MSDFSHEDLAGFAEVMFDFGATDRAIDAVMADEVPDDPNVRAEIRRVAEVAAEFRYDRGDAQEAEEWLELGREFSPERPPEVDAPEYSPYEVAALATLDTTIQAADGVDAIEQFHDAVGDGVIEVEINGLLVQISLEDVEAQAQ